MDNDYSHGAYGRNVTPSAASTAVPTPLRPSTPNTDNGRNPFGDGVESQASHRGGLSNGTNPFASPNASRPASSFGSSSAIGTRFGDERSQRYFHSRRVRKGEVEKPWLAKKDPRAKWVTIFPILGIVIGLGVSGFLVYDGIKSVVKHKYCPVLDENWANGFNTDVWTKEVNLGGFGNGEFEETTGDETNVYIENGQLVIKPTLQNAALIEKDNTIDLIAAGTCTSDVRTDCIAATNTTAGNLTIVPPTLSGRVNTKKGAKIKYGRVEVTAKLPVGDWLWPAIWMLPVTDTYGPWPASGEIDIMESRGNNWTYGQGGNDIMSSALHWGPDTNNDGWWRTNHKRPALHTTYSAGFNTFGLEWSQKYLFTYVNSRLWQVLYTDFNEPMWVRGGFPAADQNGTKISDIWSQTGRDNTPFDQYFYLILNVAVGGTNGWFQDGASGKPWVDSSPNAKIDFWNSQDQWFPTWTAPEMRVQRVQMWQQCDGDEDLTDL